MKTLISRLLACLYILRGKRVMYNIISDGFGTMKTDLCIKEVSNATAN